MVKRKLTKEDLDKVRNIEGFPIGTDEDIIALSDAPYYTACPNPFIQEFIEENGTPYDEETDDYHREPFAADVSEGKTNPIYMAHTYHTKVPHKAIMQYILHYTKPGDIVLDGFCGTGMTGVAAQSCDTPDYEIESKLKTLSYTPKWGARKAVLNDLSPAATFIAANYNADIDAFKFVEAANGVLDKVNKEVEWVYTTTPEKADGFLPDTKGIINYTIWSDVFICPSCGEEFVYWDVAVDEKGNMRKEQHCPHCHAIIKKSKCERAKELYYNRALDKTSSFAKQVPVLINYTVGGKKYNKKPDDHDLELLEKVKEFSSSTTDYWYPTDEVPHGVKTSDPINLGITNVNLFYTDRNLYVLSVLWEEARKTNYRNQIWFCITSVLIKTASKLHNIGLKNGKINLAGAMPNALFIPSMLAERNIITLLRGKIKDITPVFSFKKSNDNYVISTGSSTDLRMVPDNSIDYIFVDPPFGDNLMYSELSFIWEAWLKVKTNNKDEAIINTVQKKGVHEYQELFKQCFNEFYRCLKPGRWITVEFHNSKNSVWMAINEAIQSSGFIISYVKTLDKGQGSYNQQTALGAVKQDLAISAYKPKEEFRREFVEKTGSEETAWAFVRQHLANLPVVVDADHNDKIDIIAERQAYLLFDRMVAYHIMNGIPVPIDATDFYKGLDEKFLKRDGMYFLPDQVNEYDTARIKMDVEPIQFELFVSNEKSAIAWLYQQLDTPQTYAELQPKFMQEVKSVDRYEDMPELSVMLDENFIQDDKGRWYIPDRTKEGDVAKLREKNLWKEFESYMNSKGKLKLFRSEAIRVGFSRLWKDKNYQAIVDMAERLPEQTIQEDDKLLMYYDISLSRVQ
ncbi:DNA methyltransferase [Mitsuokella multacida]|uniref:DNA methyltransferase n=1 Tax=Mitsuokella multacida TaxID=52226 RepID=UPI0022E4798A|nr:DNA methyltransferase [Mitsuokella multacida]